MPVIWLKKKREAAEERKIYTCCQWKCKNRQKKSQTKQVTNAISKSQSLSLILISPFPLLNILLPKKLFTYQLLI